MLGKVVCCVPLFTLTLAQLSAEFLVFKYTPIKLDTYASLICPCAYLIKAIEWGWTVPRKRYRHPYKINYHSPFGRVLHAIPSNEAIDTVEVLQSRSNPTVVPWKGGAILGILDIGRDAWIHRDDWIRNGIHIGSGRKYKDSYFLQAQAMCYINS